MKTKKIARKVLAKRELVYRDDSYAELKEFALSLQEEGVEALKDNQTLVYNDLVEKFGEGLSEDTPGWKDAVESIVFKEFNFPEVQSNHEWFLEGFEEDFEKRFGDVSEFWFSGEDINWRHSGFDAVVERFQSAEEILRKISVNGQQTIYVYATEDGYDIEQTHHDSSPRFSIVGITEAMAGELFWPYLMDELEQNIDDSELQNRAFDIVMAAERDAIQATDVETIQDYISSSGLETALDDTLWRLDEDADPKEKFGELRAKLETWAKGPGEMARRAGWENEGLQPEDLEEDLAVIKEIYPDAELTMENEYLTLWIDGKRITQGESEVEARLKQIIKENGLRWARESGKMAQTPLVSYEAVEGSFAAMLKHAEQLGPKIALLESGVKEMPEQVHDLGYKAVEEIMKAWTRLIRTLETEEGIFYQASGAWPDVKTGAVKKRASRYDDFTTSYIETALWSESDESDESGGEPFDANYSSDDIAGEAISEMARDCEKFQKEYGHLWAEVEGVRGAYSTEASAGHDFWLTRNGHGAGFWDGDWPEEVGEALTKASEKFGACNLYLGNDGKIYYSVG